MLDSALWIGTGQNVTCPEFQKTVKLEGKVKSAALSLTCVGVYEARINGRRVGDFILAPGCTVYDKRLQVQTYDVTDMLSAENTLTITVGSGWHKSRLSEKRPEINARPRALIAELSVTYEDGKTLTVPTDGSWSVRPSHVTFNDIYDGETYDATLDPGPFRPVELMDFGRDFLIPQEGEEIRECGTVLPRALITTPRGEHVIDFGQNLTGYVAVTVTAHAGDAVELSCAEVLDKDGNFYNGNYRTAKSKMTFICREGHAEYKPRFTFYGFRYIRVDKFPGKIDLDAFRAVVLHSDIKRTGYIRSSSPKLNRLFENTLWSQRGNFVDIPTDCPQRDERMGWTGDAQVFTKTACYNYDVKKFFEKWLADLRADQRPDGSVPDTIPNFWNSDRVSTAWADVAAVIPWCLYEMYGDRHILEDSFDSMRRWVDFMTGDTSDKYLWTGPGLSGRTKHYGDWLAMDAPEGDRKGATPDDFIASAFYAYSTSLLVKAGHALGRDVSEYEKLYRNIVSKFKETFTGFTTHTQYVLALYFGLTDDKNALAATLDRLIHDNGDRLMTGFVGTPYLLYALSDNGYVETAYDLLLQEAYPSWLYEVDHGATTIWEHWDGIREDGTFWSDRMNSYNHYAYGSVMDWVYSVAGGIRPALPGFERATVAPTPSRKLDSLEVEYLSIRGPIISRWERTGTGFRYEISTPVPADVIISGVKHDVQPGKYVFFSD